MLNEQLYTKKGSLRKRKPKQERNYFNQDTEDAILKYLVTSNDRERNKLYNDHIDYSFYKLVENIINQPRFGFAYLDTESKEDVKHEVITFLLSKLHLYNQEKGKAFSYFGTIAKRYMINLNITNYNKTKNKVMVEDYEELEGDRTFRMETTIDEENQTDIGRFLSAYVKHVDKNLETLFPKERDLKTADAIMELFRKRESLDIFNKKALYIYIREMIDVDTPQITKIMKRLKDVYTKLYNKYYEQGYV